MSKKRTKLEIMHDILEVIKSKNGKIKPTHILYKSNLSYQMMEEYLDELKENGLITEQKIEENTLNNKNIQRGKTYSLTKKGFDFLHKYSVILDFTNTFGLNKE